MRTNWLVFVGICLASINAAYGDLAGSNFVFTSVSRLIARPELYKDHVVYVRGYYSYRNEESKLFATKEDQQIANSPNAVWIDFSDKHRPEFLRHWHLWEGYVHVKGTFRYGGEFGYGHLGVSSSQIDTIKIFEPLPDDYLGRDYFARLNWTLYLVSAAVVVGLSIWRFLSKNSLRKELTAVVAFVLALGLAQSLDLLVVKMGFSRSQLVADFKEPLCLLISLCVYCLCLLLERQAGKLKESLSGSGR